MIFQEQSVLVFIAISQMKLPINLTSRVLNFASVI
jgi:hypothetical protein